MHFVIELYVKRIFEVLFKFIIVFSFRTYTANNESLFAIALRT